MSGSLKLEKLEFDEMTKLPCLFACEDTKGFDARIGRITEFRKRAGKVKFKFEFDKSLPAIPTDVVKKLVWELIG